MTDTITCFDLFANSGTPPITLEPRCEDARFLAFIRLQPSCVDGSTDGIEAHHVIFRSKGNSAADYFAIPLTVAQHRELHAIGHTAFVEKYNLNLTQIVVRLFAEYVRQVRAGLA